MGSGEEDVSQIRVGLKREFKWMLKAQLELGVLPPARKRVSRFQSLSDNGGSNHNDQDSLGKKKTGPVKKRRNFVNSGQCKVVHSQATSVLDGVDGDVVVTGAKVGDDVTEVEAVITGSSDVGVGPEKNGSSSGLELHDVVLNNVKFKNLVEGSCEMEMNPSERTDLKKVPMRLKELLGTGLLEGLRVRYIQGSRGKQRQECELEGIIQGTGILCSCTECRGTTVVPPTLFELHAGSGNKRPPEYIYLDNGKCLRDVLNACKDVELDSLKAVIQKAISPPNRRATSCLFCNAWMPDAGDDSSFICASCSGTILPGPYSDQTTYSSKPSSADGYSAPCQSAFVSDVSNRRQNVSNTHPKTKREGKLTRKDLRMHKSILDEIPEEAHLEYRFRGEALLTGVKRDCGIYCNHCNEVISPSAFEECAGHGTRRKPYANIYTSDGISLHQLSLELSKIRKPTADERDDLCSFCEDGGVEFWCGTCPRAFHHECVGILNPPEGNWQCKYCRNIYERDEQLDNDGDVIASALARGGNVFEEITKRCTRTVGAVEKDLSHCAICRGREFNESGFDDKTVLFCDQCDREYHIGCLREHLGIDLKKLPEGEWFCSTSCANMNIYLQKLIEEGGQKLPQTLADIIMKKFEAHGLLHNVNPNVSWRLLRGKMASEDSMPWLSSAVSIFREQFDPIIDSSTCDLIPHVVHGMQIENWNFLGMYCAVLVVDSVVVSVGIFRIFGEEVAELPLVATRTEYQGKGYFQALYYSIENLLSSLNVKTLVLPAAEEAQSLWKNKFGFVKLDEKKLKELKRQYKLLIFDGTTVLHKSVPRG